MTDRSPAAERPAAGAVSLTDGGDADVGRDRADGASGGTSDAESDDRCAHCGQSVDTSNWHPVAKRRDDDGSLRFFSFCSEACQDAWLDGRTDR